MWQTDSTSRSKSPAAGPAGRRRVASFNVGLARSYDLWGSAYRELGALRPIAASGDNSMIVIALGLGGSTRRCSRDDPRRDRRAGQQRRCLAAGGEIASDAGAGLATRSR